MNEAYLPKKTPELVRQAEKMHANGMSYYSIGKALRVSSQAIKTWLDPEYAEMRRRSRNASRTLYRRKKGVGAAFRTPPVPHDDIAARLAEIPPDTRDLTGRLMGDPRPARSALAQRKGAAE